MLEFYSSKFFGADNCPFSQAGAYTIASLTITLLTGLILLLYYVPTPAIAHLRIESTFVAYLRAIHHASADLSVLLVLLHVIRTWATERFRGPRARTWAKGLVTLPILGIIGWAGFILPWDSQAMVLLSWGQDMLSSPDRWPILGWLHIGTLLGMLLKSAGNETDLLLRIFAIHVGGGLLMIQLVIWHLKRVTPPRIILPTRAWLVLIVLVLVIARMMPTHFGSSDAFNPFAPPTWVNIDFILNFPLLLYPYLGAPFLTAIILIILLGLILIPRLEPYKPIVAVVDEMKCDGCRLCMQDCPYGAITMVAHPDPNVRSTGAEVASILTPYCNACGTCVGSCESDGIELPDLTSRIIRSKIDAVLGVERHPEGEGREE